MARENEAEDTEQAVPELEVAKEVAVVMLRQAVVAEEEPGACLEVEGDDLVEEVMLEPRPLHPLERRRQA